MNAVFIGLIIILTLIVLVIIACYTCFRLAFYVVKKEESDEFTLPNGKIYEPYKDIMYSWANEIKGSETESVQIKSFDGLTLYAKYYEYQKGAPIELMMHGYRGRADRDLCGGVQRCFKLKRNAFIVEQRACGKSEGKVISFGINESKDCLYWIDFLINHFGKDVKIILTGISMGASTVLITAGEKLPENVIGVLADCGFTTAKDIIKKVIKDLKLPPNILYPFVKWGAKIFGKVDIEEKSALEQIKKCKIPVILFHGQADDFVPCDMSKELYKAAKCKKRLVIIPGAGHGLSYIVDKDIYLKELGEFFG